MSDGMSGGNTPSVRVLDGNQPTGSLTDINRFAANAEPTVNFNRLAAFQSVTPPSRDAEVRVVVDTAIDFGSSVVVVAVGDGDKHQTFLVQENLLCARSKALKSRLSETTVESGLKTVSLNELDPEAFELYFQFLYSGRIPSKPVYPSPDEHTLLAKLYVLICSLEDVPAQNAALDAIHAKSQELISISVPALPRSEGVRVVYHGTKGACGARRLMVDMFLSMGSGVLMRPFKDEFPPEFMVELALSLMGSLPSKRGYIVKPKEQYHETMAKEDTVPAPLFEFAQTESEPAS